MHAGQRERGVVVIKRGIGPIDRVMADLARGGEASRRVSRVRGARVVLLVARVAQRAIQRIVVVDMAIDAGTRRHHVGIRERKPGCGVIEFSIGPQIGVVASVAS